MLAARGGAPVRLLCRSAAEAETLRQAGQHARRLPGVSFPETLAVEDDPEAVLSGASLVIVAVPSDRFRQNLRRIAPYLPADAVVLSATKGLELPAGLRMSEVLAQELPGHPPGRFAVLSGPNLAGEVIAGKPAVTVVAASEEDSRSLVQDALMSPAFRIYTSDDVVGVEMGGALKNIIALAAGIADGMEAGDNAKAALVTRGLNEIGRLGIAAGAQLMTFAGLAGLGDVMATCSQPVEPQPSRWRGTGPGSPTARHPGRHGSRRRGGQHHRGRAGNRRAAGRRHAHHPPDVAGVVRRASLRRSAYRR